MLLESALN